MLRVWWGINTVASAGGNVSLAAEFWVPREGGTHRKGLEGELASCLTFNGQYLFCSSFKGQPAQFTSACMLPTCSCKRHARTSCCLPAQYLVKMHVGNPPQAFEVILDTGSNALWVASFDRKKSSTYRVSSAE